MRAGTEHVFALVAKLSDAELAEPSALPEWSRAHVVAHLARNAEALIRLVAWARTGVETPMYPSREARAADIAASAGHPPERLRAELTATAADLDAALAGAHAGAVAGAGPQRARPPAAGRAGALDAHPRGVAARR